MNDRIILKKGTVVKLNGFPCELVADTEIVSAVLAREGLSYGGHDKMSLSVFDALSSNPTHAASPVSLATSSSSPEST